MRSSFAEPVNIGSEEMVTINQLAAMVIKISGKHITVTNVPGPVGVRGRRSDNRLIKQKLGWEPSEKLVTGMEKTYRWIETQIFSNSRSNVIVGQAAE
jgi:nucleoside-diphosphate-sugar epimerase